MISVLYVDDEEGLVELTKIFLERSGVLFIDTALSAIEAIKKIESGSYDGIISDYQMPVMDGIAFLKYVRDHYPDLPFILFTGKGREEIVIEALNSGADFYLQKGGDPKSQFAELEYKILLAFERRNTAVELSESRQRMTDIINHLPDATLAIDLDGTVIAWNQAMEEMTGMSKKEILGTGDHSYAIPFYGTRRPILLDLVLGPNEEIEKKYPYIIRKGKRLISEIYVPLLYGGKGAYLWFIASPLYDTHGNITGAIESIRDVTDRKLAEAALSESEELLSNIVENIPDMIFVKDAEELRFVKFNKAGEELLGYSRQELLGKNDYDFFPKDEADFFTKKDREVLINKITVDIPEEKVQTRNLGLRLLHTKKIPIYNKGGEVRYLLGISEDITVRKDPE